MFGIEEAVKEAQAGGSGIVIYFRKEGRALGEVTKYLVYNVRKRTGDRASEYFERTEGIAGVKDVPPLTLPPAYNPFLDPLTCDRCASKL
jgi:GTP cyclohydrolase II